WVTADGLGLLAHAARRDPEETPAEQARRVGGALGRALTALRLDGAEVVRARADLLDQLGAAANPGRSLVLESLAPDHPSWLEPRGTWRALSEAGADEARARRRQLVAEPLRLAVLASVDGAQADAVATALDGWVGPLRGPAETCPAATALTPRRGQLTVDSSVDDAGAATAWLAVSLGPDELPAARATAWLMNRPGGWLEQALRAPALASAARATVLGGARARALVLELTTAPAGAADAVAQVRGLFERLARGAATAADARLAAREEARVRAAEALDPRRRIVDLWRGASARGPLELGELHRFHARAFTADAPLVVTVKPRG
ncbi:MAG: hypothetical protein OZ921_20215, partial [Sorangiineae bacterium]|nr:hypothetical protein [Sorangiineae bacterium]